MLKILLILQNDVIMNLINWWIWKHNKWEDYFFLFDDIFCKCYVIKFAVIDITLKEYRGDKKIKRKDFFFLLVCLL